MNRRQYLAAVSALSIGSLAGCTTADIDRDAGDTDAGTSTDGNRFSGHDDHEGPADEASGDGDGGGDGGAEADEDGESYAAEENVELDMMDRFVLDDFDSGSSSPGWSD